MSVRLTARETDVLRMVRLGKTNKEIGQELHISERGVKFHVSNLLVKGHVKSRIQLALLDLADFQVIECVTLHKELARYLKQRQMLDGLIERVQGLIALYETDGSLIASPGKVLSGQEGSEAGTGHVPELVAPRRAPCLGNRTGPRVRGL